MSMRAADIRFLLPLAPRRVLLLDAAAGECEAFEAAGIEIVTDRPDLIVARRGRAAEAAALRAPAVIVRGSRSRRLRRAGYATRTIVVRRGEHGPRLLVPIDASAAIDSVFLAGGAGRRLRKRIVTRAALLAARSGLPVIETLTVASATGRPALLEAAATAAGIDLGADWCLLAGEGDDLQRAVWLSFAERGRGATWAVKFSRVRGNGGPFEREEVAARALDRLPDELRRHVPRRLAQFELDGIEGVIETAAPGVLLQDALEHGVEHDEVVDRAASWIVQLGAATRQPAVLEAELARLESTVLPAWQERGSPVDLARRVADVPGVLQHNDLGSWNVFVDGEMFTVLDWESSRLAGLPLWDLVYFLTDALTAHGPRAPETRTERMLALLRGESEDSTRLFSSVAQAAEGIGISLSSVGPIVTLGWLQHGLSHLLRRERGTQVGAETFASSLRGPLERLGEPWLNDPALGVDWPSFRRWSGQ